MTTQVTLDTPVRTRCRVVARNEGDPHSFELGTIVILIDRHTYSRGTKKWLCKEVNGRGSYWCHLADLELETPAEPDSPLLGGLIWSS